MTTATETRPEYMTDAQLNQAYADALETRFHLDVIPYDDDSLSAYHAELDAAEDRLLAIATEMEQRTRFSKPAGPQPPLPADI